MLDFLYADALLPQLKSVRCPQMALPAGILDATLHIPERDLMCARGLAQLVGPTEKVLQGYKARAVASGQTFGHVIRLEAAVLGW